MSSKIDIWLPIYVGDYLKDTGGLKLAEHGAYFKLMMAYWQTGCLEHCLGTCYRIAGAFTEDEQEAVNVVVGRFFVEVDGVLRNKRLDAELISAHARREKASSRALKAAAARWGRQETGKTDAPSIPQAVHGDMLDECPSPSPSPSHIKTRAKALAPKAARVSQLTEMDLIRQGVDQQVAEDWLAIRKAHRAPLTKTALEAAQREAAKAGMALGDAIRIAVENSWRGFKAEWLQNKLGDSGHDKRTDQHQRRADTIAGLTGIQPAQQPPEFFAAVAHRVG